MMEKHTYDLFGGRTLHTALYKDVQNSPALRQKLVDQHIDVALINPQLVIDPFQVHAAATRVLLCDANKKLTSNSIHAELVFNLSGSRNVRESFRRFGITDESKMVLLCVFDADDAKVAAAAKLIEGTLVPWAEFGKHIQPEDEVAIKKFYKIQEEELKVSSLLDAIVCRIATKTCNK